MLKICRKQPKQMFPSKHINVKTTLIVNVHSKLIFDLKWCICIDVVQRWNEVAFSTLKNGYHNFTSIVSYHQIAFGFNPNSTAFRQRWQHDVDSTSTSRRPTSRRYFKIYQRWKNAEFEKWRAIRTSMGSVGGMLACVAYLCGWRAGVGGVDCVLAWVAC